MRFLLALLRSNETAEAVRVYDQAMINTMTDIPGDQELAARMSHNPSALRALYAKGHPLLDLRFDAKNPDVVGLQAAAHWILGTQRPFHDQNVPAQQMLQHLQTAARLRPRWDKAQFALAELLNDQGRKQEAKVAYEKVVNVSDGDLKTKAQQALKTLPR